MSATGSTPTNTSISPALSRLSRAVSSGRAATASPRLTRGADAAPDTGAPAPRRRGAEGARGGSDAAEGARNIRSASPRSMRGAAAAPEVGQAPTPEMASADSYAAAAGGSAAAGGTGSTELPGTGAWDGDWQRRFEKLQLAPADIAFLAQGNFDAATLDQIARELEGVAPVDPAQPVTAGTPVDGYDAGSATSADGPLPGDVMPAGQPGSGASTSAWSPQWKQKFTDVMTRMGMSPSEISEQMASVEGQPLTEEQLQTAYSQMKQSLGAFDQTWHDRFEKLLGELKVPEAQKQEALTAIAGSGMTAEQLQQAYDEMLQQKPAWNADWERKFQSLELPAEMMKQLKDSGAPAPALEEQFNKLLETKMKYSEDGSLKKLTEAGADPDEKWGVMLQGVKGSELDKAIEGIRSSNVPAWKRIASVAVNMIPGVYAVQFLTGKDWITGDKIDRTNPLNIIGAVASGFSGFSAVRGAIQGVQGLRAANTAYQAGKAATAAGQVSRFSSGAMHAIESAQLVTKFDKGLKLFDYVKAATPVVNRFGEAGRLAAVGRGYYQGAQLVSNAAALRNVAGGGAVVDKATKGHVFGELMKGGSIDDALTGVSRSSSASRATISSNAEIARLWNTTGFVQGSTSGLIRGNANWKFNPFRNDATINVVQGNGTKLLELGRGVNFGTRGGTALGLGAIQGTNIAGNAGAIASTANRLGVAASNPMTAGNPGVALKTADWAQRLGVTGGSRFRALLQLDPSSRAARNISQAVERGGSKLFRVTSRLAAIPGNSNMIVPSLYAGTAIGMTGKQMQPVWDSIKDDPGMVVGNSRYEAERAAAAQAAEQEQAELERLYREQQAAGGTTAPAAGTTSGSAPGGVAPAAAARTEPQVVGTSPTGGQLIYDPSSGAVLDTSNGDVYDPNTGQIVGNVNQPASSMAAAPTGAAPTTGGMPAPAAGVADAAQGAVYVDPQTGYYIDQATGLAADPRTGNVYDPSTGQLVGNLSQAAQPAA